MPMNPELKKKWVDALRSGKYKQGKNRLHNTKDNSFCCLGVLCEVAGFEKIEGGRDGKGNSYRLPDGEVCYVSISNAFFGFSDDEDFSDTPRDKVVDYNDNEGKRHKGFKGIATYIEKHF